MSDLNNSQTNDLETSKQPHVIRDSIMFVVDGSPSMFENDYHHQCLQAFKSIYQKKCASNKKDRMGLVVFGTKSSNCDVPNLNVLHEFQLTTLDGLKAVYDMCELIDDKPPAHYQSNASADNYPLHEALNYALQQIRSVKAAETTRNIIILCTRTSDPSKKISNQEQRKLEDLMETYKDNWVKFRVVKLGEDWDDTYYSELRKCLGGGGSALRLEDLDYFVLKYARKIRILPWRFGGKIEVECAMYSFVSLKWRKPQKQLLHRKDNRPLIRRRFYVEYKRGESLDEETLRDKKVYEKKDFRYGKTYAGKKIWLKGEEKQLLVNLQQETGLDIIAIKNVKCDPLLHARSPHFITYNDGCSEESKAFFNGFLQRCQERKLMPVCSVLHAQKIKVANLVPSADDGGFYVYFLAVTSREKEGPKFEKYIYNSQSESLPIVDEAVKAFSQIIRRERTSYDPRAFRSPKAARFTAHLEALALGRPLGALPKDTTLPPAPKKHTQTQTASMMEYFGLDAYKQAREARLLTKKAPAKRKPPAAAAAASANKRGRK